MLRNKLTTAWSQAVGVLRFVYRHPANRGHRLSAVLRAASFQIRGRLGRPTKVTIGRTMRMWAVLHHSGSSVVAYANPPDYAEMHAWRKLLNPGDLFVDIGSNVGSYTLWAADAGAKVIAVEPDAGARDLFQQNILLNPGIDVEVLPVALAAAPGWMRFTQGLDTTNHLLPDEDAGNGRSVRVLTLDSVLDGRLAAGVKVDVEGAERLVLEGARHSLRAGRIQVLQLEWNSMSAAVLGEDRTPVAELLRANGYELFRPDERGELIPLASDEYGPDVFAVLRDAPADAAGAS